MSRRIGVLGGTFDPVHLGHLLIAEYAASTFALDKVSLVPAKVPPHKEGEGVSPISHRLRMVSLAILPNPGFEVSTVDVDRDGPSYTVDTLRLLKKQHGEGSELFFICGADSLAQLKTWKEPAEILNLCQFIVANRPGFDAKPTGEALPSCLRPYASRVHMLNVPGMEISSTEIRLRVSQGMSIRYLVPDAVAGYIREHGLYLDRSRFSEASRLSFNRLRERLISELPYHLSPELYHHCLRVEQEALVLARLWNVDEGEASIAALLHDCAKGLPRDALLKHVDEFGIVITDIERLNSLLLHSHVGAEVARRQWGVRDERILDAIRYHTTGRAGMSNLEKIIFLADAIEPGRGYPGVDRLRRLAREDLDAACLASMEETLFYVAGRGLLIHPRTVEARNWLIMQNDGQTRN